MKLNNIQIPNYIDENRNGIGYLQFKMECEFQRECGLQS